MARLRFPGRPGNRVDRARIPFCSNDATESADPAVVLVSNLRRGIQEFKEICGESEEDEFEGFTEEDVRQSGKKLRAAFRAEHKHTLTPLQIPDTDRSSSQASSHKSSAQSTPSSHQRSPNVHGIFGSAATPGEVPPLSREEILQKALAAKQLLDSLKAKHKHALQGRVVQDKVRSRKPWKPAGKAATEKKSVSKTVPSVGAESKQSKPKLVSKKAMRKSATYETPKVKISAKQARADQKVLKMMKLAEVKVRVKDVSKSSCLDPNGKQGRPSIERSKTVVKQLLQKAKQGSSRPLPKVKHTEPQSGDTTLQKRNVHTFVLPQFSRSRRAIIPNKRFIEDDPIPSALLIKKSRKEDTSSAAPESPEVECKEEIDLTSSDIDTTPEPQPVMSKTLSQSGKKKSAKSSGLSSPFTVLTSPKKSQKSTPTVGKISDPSGINSGKKTPTLKKMGADRPKSVKEEWSPASDGSFTGEPSSSSSGQTEATPTSKPSRTRLSSHSEAQTSTDSVTFRTDIPSTSSRQEPVSSFKTYATEESPGEQTPSVEQLLQLEMSPVVAVTPHKMEQESDEPGMSISDVSNPEFLLTASSSYRKGLLEQPLIVEGKRQRVPSLKVRMINRQSEESAVASESESSDPATGEDTKENGSKKEKFTLFPKAPPSAPKTFNRAGPMKLQRRDKDGKESMLTKRSGQIMLRKAKLQLNRTALNRSKAALARSLKAQLKREAKQKGRKSQPQRHSPRPGVTSPLSISVLGSGGGHPFDSPTSQPSPLIAGVSPGSQGGFASPPRIVSSLSPISLPSKKEGGELSADRSRESTKGGNSSGPRIKHVCRRAAVVLPKQLATFPAPPDPSESPTLSALPSPEKERLLLGHARDDEDDKDSSEEEKVKYKRRSQVVPRATKIQKLRAKFGRVGGKRKNRCKECKGCLAPNCGKCIYCLDSKKFGGNNVLKKACINRKCEQPKYSKQATDAFIRPKNGKGGGAGGGGGDKRGSDDIDSSQVRQGPSRMARPSAGYLASMSGDSQADDLRDEDEGGGPRQGYGSSSPPPPRERMVRAGPPRMDAQQGLTDEGGLEIMSAVGVQRHNLTHHARRLLKRKEKSGLRVRLPVVVPEPQPLVASSTLWSVPTNTRSIVHTQLKDNFYLDVVWGRGLALTMAGPTCIRAVCFLCGSAGREKMLYCCICCEPFHWFCLEVEDRPLKGGSADNWCCRRCQFCHVCGLQSGLLQCDRCQDTYHPECLGPAYPKQPSRRNVWVCTKCVRCKSCGATTPGSSTNATWTYDFSLCFDCGKLMDKGNFCPICCKCYTDDDWESKMVQCSLCDSWVHARCEGLTDEMYQLFSFLPEDIQYRCRVCSPTDPPEWRTILRDELMTGLSSVLSGLTSFKCSHHLMVIDEDKERERSQRALQRKKQTITLNNSESLRTSPRIVRHTRAHPLTSRDPSPTCDSNEPEISQDYSSMNDSDKGTSLSESFLSDKGSEKDIKLDHSCVVISPNKEDISMDAVEISDTEDNSPGNDASSGRFSEDSCERDSHKAGKMSEIGLFEHNSPNNFKMSALDKLHSLSKKDSEQTEIKSGLFHEKRTTLESMSEKRKSVLLDDCSRNVHDKNNHKSLTNHVDSDLLMSGSSVTENGSSRERREGTAVLPGTFSSSAPPGGVARNLFEMFLTASGDHRGSDEREENLNERQSEKRHQSHNKPDDNVHNKNEDNNKVDDENNKEKDDKEDHKKEHDEDNKDGILINNTEDCEPTVHTQCDQESRSSDQATNNRVQHPPPSLNQTSTCHTSADGHGDGGDREEDCPVKPDQQEEEGGGDSTLVVNDSARSTSNENSTSRNASTETSTRGSGQHVTFTVNMVTQVTDSRSLVPRFQRQFPRDFNAVRMKLDADKYASVEEFNEDMVHIIQTALSHDELFPTRRKHSNSVKSIFIKQMERVFPWFNVKTCQLWQRNRVLPQGMLPDAVVPPYSDHTYAQWLEREKTLSSPQLSPFKKLAVAAAVDSEFDHGASESCEDVRQCALCLEFTDDYPEEAGRLLYAGQDDWVHVNCALWSAEVFEEEDGSLQNIHVAMVRGRQLRCNHCQMQGATVGCCVRGCPANYHFLCARRQMCLFKDDKTVFCYQHRSQASPQIENQKGFAVQRRVCVDMADVKCMKKSWQKGLDASCVNILFGCCTVESLGSLLPLSDCKGCLLPLDFRCSRVYWSTVDARRRTVYTCRIIEVRPTPTTPEFRLRDVRVIHDPHHPEFAPLHTLDLPSMGLGHLLHPHEEVMTPSDENMTPGDEIMQPSDEVMLVSQSSPGRSNDVMGQITEGPEHAEERLESVSHLSVSSVFSVPRVGEDVRAGERLTTKPSSSSSSSSLLPASASNKGNVSQPGVLSQARVDFSRLSANTLKLLNISLPSQPPAVTHKPQAPPPRPSSVQSEFGNLTGMIQRLNSAALRSKKPSVAQRSDVEQTASCNQGKDSFRTRRAMSLSPVAFTHNAFSASVLSPPGRRRRSLSPSDSPSCSISLRQPLTVTPIPEHSETDVSGPSAINSTRRRAIRGTSAPPGGPEVFVDLTEDDVEVPSRKNGDVVHVLSETGTMSGSYGKDGQVVFLGKDGKVAQDKDGTDISQNDFSDETPPSDTESSPSSDMDCHMTLAQQVLQTVPKEILESSEVKVLVVPDDVSEEDAIKLAEEALRQTQGEIIAPRKATCEEEKSKNDDAFGTLTIEEETCGKKMVDETKRGNIDTDSTEHVEELEDFDFSQDQDHEANKDNSHSVHESCVKNIVTVQDSETTLVNNATDSSYTQSQSSSSNITNLTEISTDLSTSMSQSVNDNDQHSQNVEQVKESITSSLMMSQAVAENPVYDKTGNLIGRRRHRPYVVETVQTKGDCVDIEINSALVRGLISDKLHKDHVRLTKVPSPSPSDACEKEGKRESEIISTDKSSHNKKKNLSSNQAETSVLGRTQDQQLKTKTSMKNMDSHSLQCSVSVHKLCISDITSSVSVKDVCQRHGVHRCSVVGCLGNERSISQSDDLSFSRSRKQSGTSETISHVVSETKMEANSESRQKFDSDEISEDSLSSVGFSDMSDIKQNFTPATHSSSKLCDKLGLARAMSPESNCLQSIMSVGGNPFCNGVVKEGSPGSSSLCSKDNLLDLALNPPSSITKDISEALRTVECRVSLERLADDSAQHHGNVTSTSDPQQANVPLLSHNAQHVSSAETPKAGTEADSIDLSRTVTDTEFDNEISVDASACRPVPGTKVNESCPSFTGALDDFFGKMEPNDISSAHNAGPAHPVKVKAEITDEDCTIDTHATNGTESNFSRLIPAPESAYQQSRTDNSLNCDSDKGDNEDSKGDNDVIPLHTEIALRIKAESLARSSPGESGPFKCPTCKRLYRTADSFNAHAKSCDFDLSTSDEEEEGDEEKKEGRLSVKEEDEKQNVRTSLRQSTLTQRRAMESNQQQLALQAAEKNTFTQRPCKTSPTHDGWSSCKSPTHEQLSPLPAARGRSHRTSSNDMKDVEPGRRGRGRPRKMSGHSSDIECQPIEKCMELSPKESLLGAVGLVSKECLEKQATLAALRTGQAASLQEQRISAAYLSPDRDITASKSLALHVSKPISSPPERRSLRLSALSPSSRSRYTKNERSQNSANNLDVSQSRMDSLSQGKPREQREKTPVQNEASCSAQSSPISKHSAQEKRDQCDDYSDIQSESSVTVTAICKKDIETDNHNTCLSVSDLACHGSENVCEDTSDCDSDVIITGEDPGAGNLPHRPNTLSNMSEEPIVHPFLCKFVLGEGKKFGENTTHLAQNKTESKSSLASKQTETKSSWDKNVNVINKTEKTETISHTSVTSLSGTTTLQSSASSSEHSKSLSSLLLSSSNVQADIDSDDLSFTDSEDEESRTGGPLAPPPPTTSEHSCVTVSRGMVIGMANTVQSSGTISDSSINQPATNLPPNATMPNLTSPHPSPNLDLNSGRSDQTSATQLLSMLDKLSYDQKLILTQQLLKKGALSIDSSLNQSLTPSHPAGGARSGVGVGGGSGYSVGNLAGMVPTAVKVSAAAGLGTGGLRILHQHDILGNMTNITPTLISQQAQQQGSVQILHHRPGLMLPVAPGNALPPFSPNPTAVASPLLRTLAVSAANSRFLSAPTLLSPQATPSVLSHMQATPGVQVQARPTVLSVGGQAPPTMLSRQAPPTMLSRQGQTTPAVISVRHAPTSLLTDQRQATPTLLSVQQAPPSVLAGQGQAPATVLCPPGMMSALSGAQALVPPSARVGYMGSFVVDPTKTGSDEKARLQLLSLIQGPMAAAAQSQSSSGVTSTTSTTQTRVVNPPRVIRLVVDKPAQGERPVAPSSSQSVVRIMQVSSSTVSPSITPTLPTSVISPLTSVPSLVPLSSWSEVAGSSLTESFTSTVIVRKRQMPSMLKDSQPIAKQPRILPFEKSIVEAKDSSPDLTRTQQVVPPGGEISAPPPCVLSSAASVAVGPSHLKVAAPLDEQSSHTAALKTLVKKRIANKVKKQTGPGRKKKCQNEMTGIVGKVAPKPKTARAAVRKKATGTGRKGRPLSHPIVHFSHQSTALPQAAVEEEITDTPLRQNSIHPPSQPNNVGRKAWPKDLPRLAFEITSDDGFSCQADSMEEAWRQVTEKVQDARAAARMKQMSYGGVNGVHMFGVGHDSVVYLVEQLAGAGNCRHYKFRFQQYEPPEDEELLVNPSGAARCSPFTTRKPYDVFSFLMSRHRHRPCQDNAKTKEEEMEHKSSRRATSMELPMAMRFRKLQEHAKEAVGVYRSRIHGRGLYCKRNIDNGEMVIEYSGEIIRSTLTDKREKYYESKGIGCYMFRIDDCEVVDATMHGSAARFINHSCEPNCYSKVISVDGKKHIVIFANRAIKKGEELTYDYKFPIEDVKIPCTCGSRKCRKYLN